MPEGPKSDKWTEKLEGMQFDMSEHEMSPYLQPENADRHVGIGVSRRMQSSHATSHVDVGVSLYISLSHASRHVCARVLPRMRPEACRLTHRRSCGAFSLASDFYKYPTPPFSFRHPFHTKASPKTRRPSGTNARVLRSDRAWLELGRYIATEQDERSVATIRTKLYLGNIHCDVFLTEHDLLRKDILVFCGDLDVNFVVTVFDPNIRKILQHKMSPYLQPENADRHVGIGVSRRMHSSHTASHVDVGVSLYMSLSHLSRHVCVRVSPRMRPEACRLTHRRSCGAFSLASDFYKYPTLPSVSDIHSTPKPLQKRG
ncbi:hypothetical protein F2Q68_00043100 [Brassica cretica]|uniref:Uncharacterized protein n=1 Tax=Brassica cretica TaxID=69181 RepID=A0A8S9LPN5_BRACR|nr:hypothetical protein F2Q68_00043100 [Brassica cretica]